MDSEFIDDEGTEVRNERMTRNKVDKRQSVRYWRRKREKETNGELQETPLI
jgi:hypothetical protein